MGQSITKEEVLNQITEALLFMGNVSDNYDEHFQDGNRQISTAMSIILRFTPVGSTYQKMLEKLLKECDLANFNQVNIAAQSLKGQLQTLRYDISNGYLSTVEEVIHANMFGDFMGMAEEFLDKKYILPAAVLIGAVLEETLRKLCLKSGIDIEKEDKNGILKPVNAATLNIELKKKDIYNEITKKQVDYWQNIRNSAAHGRTEDFSSQDVSTMYQGVLSFIGQYPA